MSTMSIWRVIKEGINAFISKDELKSTGFIVVERIGEMSCAQQL